MNDKPRLIEVTDSAELAALDASKGDIGAPFTLRIVKGGKVFADADELRAWRLQHTSQSEQR